MNRLINVLGMLAIVVAAFIASAGAINYGCTSHEHIYTVFGVLNFAGWAFVAYKWAKGRGIL